MRAFPVNTYNKRCFSALRALAVIGICCLPSFAEEIDIRSKSLEYDQLNKYVIADGSVTVVWQDKVLNAEYLEFWTEKEYLIARGSVSFSSDGTVLKCDSLVYDYKARTATADKNSGYLAPWYFAAHKMEKLDEKRYRTGSMRMTTCENSRPHYTIRATSAKIFTGKRITVFNPVFFVRSVPVFYLPVFSQGLGKKKLSIEVEPGYNKEDGFIAKIIIGYPLTEHSYGKLYLDSFEKRGWGQGAEYSYNNPDKFMGTLYGYHIKEDTTKNEYWNFRAAHWQRINSYWTSRSNINFVNNETFNSLYLADNWRLTSRQIDSNLAFTRQTPKSNLQVSTSRNDSFNAATGVFEPVSIITPRIDYTRFSLLKKSKYNSTLSSYFQNSYNKTYDYYERRGFVRADIKRSYSFLKRKITVTPLLGLSETWVDRDTSTVYGNYYTTRYLSNFNTRFYVTRQMSWDLGYTYELRSKVNLLDVDTKSNDYGEDINRIYGQNLFYYGRVTVRNSTSYNLHKNRDETIDDWREKFAPLVNELTWAPNRSLSLYLKEENNIYVTYSDLINSDYLRSVQTIVTLGQMDNEYVSLGAFYQADRPDELGFNTSFGFWPTKKWKLDYRLSAVSLEKFNSVRFNDQQLSVYRNLHCWEVKVTYRRRLEAEEVYLQLNLTSAAKERKKYVDPKFEKEFYPWR